MASISISFFRGFFQKESAGGILLMLAALLAMIVANSPFAHWYEWFLNLHLDINIFNLSCPHGVAECSDQGHDVGKIFQIDKSAGHWINDGLMVFFFLLVGLELKREVLEGELSDKRNMILPGLGAIGGMVAPALIYVAFNYKDPSAIQGWAIPAATDIAFALGILSLLGPSVPVSLKVFLTSLAIFDDIGAIVIIAIFYTDDISVTSLIVSAICIAFLAVFNRKGVTERSLYFSVGGVMWVALLKSGVHATLAGVILAMFIPMRAPQNRNHSPLKDLEHDLHAMVAFICLPVFAFTNSGINFTGVGLDELLHSVPLGIALGLFFGKMIGIFTLCGSAILLGLVSMPKGMGWLSLFGVSILCGIGFTMSLFIGELAFASLGPELKVFDQRIGIILGSLVSGIIGFMVLKYALATESNKS